MSTRALSLVKSCHSSSNELISSFNTDDLRAVMEEINVAFKENHQSATLYQEGQISKEIFPMIEYRHALLQRNLRCLFAYSWNRLNRLKEIRWNLGPTLNPDIKESLTDLEVQWFNNYSKNLASYMFKLPKGMNIMTNLKPPKAPYVRVKCLIDHGEMELENGDVILLQKDSIHYMPKNECEMLIRAGVLEHLTDEI